MQSTWNEFWTKCPSGYEQKIIAYGKDEKQQIYLTLPTGKTNFPLVIWLHGGGLTGDGREFPKNLWNGEIGSAEIRYRLSDGTFKATDSLADAADATAFILKRLVEFGADAENVFLGGMSAGSYLAAMIGMNSDWLAEYGESNLKFKGLLLVSGQMTTHFQLKKDLNYPVGDFEPVIDKYAPMFYAARKFAPVIFITGESGFDMPARPEENKFFAATLRALGHPCVQCYNFPGHDHCGSFFSCSHLLSRFIYDLKNGVLHG